MHVCRSTGSIDRQSLRSTDRTTDCMTLALGLCRSTGPVDRQIKNLFLNCLAVDRAVDGYLPNGKPVDRQLSKLTATTLFWLFLFFMDSNCYFLFLSGQTHP